MQRIGGRLRILGLTGVLVAFAGCSTFRTGEHEEDDKGRIVTAEEIQATGASTIWEAIRSTVHFAMFSENWNGEPDRIRTRGMSSFSLNEDMKIYIDGVKVIDIRDLDLLPADHIEYMRILSGLDGTTRYGTGSGDGVILIYTKG
jgi:outer membrane receptor for ferrienterochelin and colicin